MIFKKDLHAHDESSNSVVAANVTRKFFPPMVRVQPLNEQQGNWMEGPYWQHIPPMFAYVPYIFFKLDGQVTIEVKRLSYALVTLLTGLLFIFGVYRFRKSLTAASAATIAAILWINTPFTHELITGYAFGVSDIVLAFTAVCAFGGLIWYLKEEQERSEYPAWKVALIGILVALPIMAKSLLGAIPAAIFFGLLVWDYRNLYKKYLPALAGFIGILLVYFGSLYVSSPETFKKEIIVPIFHTTSGYEGWGRPWHWYLTNYLPQRYLFGWTWVYYAGLLFAIFNLKFSIFKADRKDKILLWLTGGWFVWNLLAVTLIQSKIPNFIYQSYLFSLFFIIYSLVLSISGFIKKPLSFNTLILSCIAIVGLIIAGLGTSYELIRFAQQFKVLRAQAYNYQTEHEKFYEVGEQLRAQGVNQSDLVIVFNPPDDCWERYYVLFLTGAESKTLLEMRYNFVPLASIKYKYRNIYFVDQSSQAQVLDIGTLDQILASHKIELDNQVQTIKHDKSSCQWLVPDSILNAP